MSRIRAVSYVAGFGSKVTYAYDSRGRLSRQVVDGTPIDYEYTKYGQLASGEDFPVLHADYEVFCISESRPLQLNAMYRQQFTVDADGVCRTEKYGHWISRSRFCRVILDGQTLQWSHPLW